MVVNPGVSRVTRFTAEARKKGRSAVASERGRERKRDESARASECDAEVCAHFALDRLIFSVFCCPICLHSVPGLVSELREVNFIFLFRSICCFYRGFFMVLFRGETIIRRGPRNSYIASLHRADISRVHFLVFLEGVSGWFFLEGFFLRKMEMSFGCHHGSFWFCFWSVELLGLYVPVLRAAAASLVV